MLIPTMTYQDILKPGNELDQMLNKKILNLYE